MGAFCDSAWLAALIALGITSNGISVEGGSVDIRCLADALHEALPAPAGRLRNAVACAAMLLAVSAAPSGCWAQTPAAQTPAAQTPAAQTPAATTPDAPVEVPQKIDASLSHSMAKAVTLKIATFSFGTVIYSVGTGSLAAGTALSAINAAASFVILTANDYSWDYFWPNTNVAANSDNFHPLASLSRNTAKYLTLKPMLTVLNVGTVVLVDRLDGDDGGDRRRGRAAAAVDVLRQQHAVGLVRLAHGCEIGSGHAPCCLNCHRPRASCRPWRAVSPTR